MKHFLGILTFSVFVTHSVAEGGTKAQMLFDRCARKAFLNEPTRMQIVAGGLEVPLLSSGHTAKLDDGTLVSFERLAYQAEVIAKEGKGASEEAFRHLDDKQAHVRVIAFDVLCRIAGKTPEGYYFGRPGGEFEGNQEWLLKAKVELKKWIAEPVVAPNRSLPPSLKSASSVRGSED